MISPTPPAPPSNPYLCPRFFQPESFTEDPIIKVILDTYDEEGLLNFGIAQEGDLINPKGLTNTTQGFVLDDFDTSGTILAGNQTLTHPDSHLVILTVTEPGMPAMVAATPAANLNQDYFDMAYDQSGDALMAGFTIQNTVNVFGESFQSAGGQDILLTSFSIDGQLLHSEQFGGVENENVSKILQNHDLLYFGGEFDGSVGDKTIGQYVFSNLVAATKRAYISFVAPWDAGGVVALSEQEQPGIVPAASALTQSSSVHQPETRVEVFPNPFNNKVRVRAFGETIAAIQVVNALGQTVYDFRDQVFSDFEIDFGENAKGIYFLKLYDHTGLLVATKSVVKMN